jgi:peptidoglycan/xylan/chitin deacetylase (PgdA/CDA1 family)
MAERVVALSVAMTPLAIPSIKVECMSINLLYHDIAIAGHEDDSGFPGPEAARYKLAPDEFALHLNRIGAVVNSRPLAAASTGPNRSAWTITFDDGGKSAMAIADELERRDWRGWFFISTDFIGQPTFCTADQIRELHRRGHVIGSHSCSHPERISNCSALQLFDEWSRSRSVLSDIVGESVIAASVPGGFYSLDVARAAARAGIQVLLNSEPTVTEFEVDGCRILGRFNVYRGMSAGDAAALVTSPVRRWRQSAFWSAKKAAKTFAAPIYRAVRRSLLQRAYSP